MHFIGWALWLAVASSEPPAQAAAVEAGFGSPVAESVLDTSRGGDGFDWTQVGWIQLDATLSGNVVHSSVNGANTVGDTALSGVSGIATIIQNSGNQVVIQNALVLNLSLQ
jgi:hypothetical protein